VSSLQILDTASGFPTLLSPILILFTESLGVRFVVGIKEFLSAFLPRSLKFGRCDVPIRPTFLSNGAQVLAEIFHRGPPEEPIAHVDLIYYKSGLEDNRVRNHRIVQRIGVFGDI